VIAYRTTRRRRGFTLIELMVVIALIAVIAALAAGTFFRIQAGENQRATESTLNKLHSLLDGKWKAVLDDAKKGAPAEYVSIAGGDRDRAIALWTHARLQSEFPESFAEVWVTTPVPVRRDIVIGGHVLPPKKAFTDIASKTYTPAPTAAEESAALFYAAINSTSVGGLAPAVDGLTQQTVTTTSGLTYYKDAWGSPITFKRWANAMELQSAPLLRSNQVRRSQMAIAAGQPATFEVKNPLDPTGKLITWPAYGGQSDNPWAEPTNALYVNRRASLVPTVGTNAFGINPPANAAGQPDFNNENFLPTLISYGPNKLPGAAGARSFPTVANPVVDDDMADNLYSFRGRREGARGD
jgi:prepilin-type N-terminal cleavage/methylation domain-containing protein